MEKRFAVDGYGVHLPEVLGLRKWLQFTAVMGKRREKPSGLDDLMPRPIAKADPKRFLLREI